MLSEQNDEDLSHNRDYSNRCLYSIVRPLFGATDGEGRCKKLWWSGGSWGRAKNIAKGSRSLPLSVSRSVGREGGREGEGGVDDAISCKKSAVVGRSVGRPRSSSDVEKAAAAATEYSVMADSAVY